MLAANSYSYVLGSLLASALVGLYHTALVGRERKAAGVPYPNSYATHAEATTNLAKYRFNCAQRAHANFLEHLPTFAITSAIAGLRYPVATAALGAAWNLGRIFFAWGYIGSTLEQKGSGRYKGFWYLLAEVGLIGAAGWTVGQMLLAA